MENQEDYLLRSYNYNLPPGQIAQYPCKERGASRLLAMDAPGMFRDLRFADLVDQLPADALVVANNTRVLPCRLLAERSGGGKLEFLLLSPLPLVIAGKRDAGDNWRASVAECLLKPGKKFKVGAVIDLKENLQVKILAKGEFGKHQIELRWQGDLEEIFKKSGQLPLPPYIRREVASADADRYQTCYASCTGAVAAPTAGLHFTPEIKNALLNKGIEWAEITLHTGYGTFSPVRCADIRDHCMHAEYVSLAADAARLIESARLAKRPIAAVGTTSLRALEGIFAARGRMEAFADWINIFIYPGQKINVVDKLITNFHLPKSSLLMLVSALAGRKEILQAYAYALAHGYKFFSYGDAMLISRKKF